MNVTSLHSSLICVCVCLFVCVFCFFCSLAESLRSSALYVCLREGPGSRCVKFTWPSKFVYFDLNNCGEGLGKADQLLVFGKSQLSWWLDHRYLNKQVKHATVLFCRLEKLNATACGRRRGTYFNNWVVVVAVVVVDDD